mmetsp:Transcript_7799/g.17112  ORF Transcript_7799/g.17112 Transcript_7799/m.17112 type:complete len:208 (-) Transcript_7799:213-836(-)
MGAEASNLSVQVGQNARGPRVPAQTQADLEKRARTLAEQNVKAMSKPSSAGGGLRKDKDAKQPYPKKNLREDYSDSDEAGLSDCEFQPTVHYPRTGSQPTLPKLSQASVAQGGGLAATATSYTAPVSQSAADQPAGLGYNSTLARPAVPRLNLGAGRQKSTEDQCAVCTYCSDLVHKLHPSEAQGPSQQRKDRGCNFGFVSVNCTIQ